MKQIQTIISIALIYFVLTNQALAFNHSANTDLIDEVIQAVNAAVENLREESRQQEEKIKQMEQELASLSTQLELCLQKSQKEGLQDALRIKVSEISGKEKAVAEQARKEAEKQLVTAKRIETLVTQMIEIVEQNKELEKSFVTLTAISRDRSKVGKLLEAIQNNNRTEANQIISATLFSTPISGIAFSWTGVGAPAGGATSAAGTTVTVSDIQNTTGVKITFQIGKLRNCLSTQNLCSGKAYSISK